MKENFDHNKEKVLIDFIVSRTGVENFTPGLERITPLFMPLVRQFKERGIKVITISGTNGKGETSMALSQMLAQSNLVPVTWTSPHIFSLCERFACSGVPIGHQQLEVLLHRHWDELEILQIKLSFYEFLFYVFCHYALSLPLTHLVLEVGLGGRYDAVNLFDADVAAITSIARDHQAILGNSYRQILSQKIGIARKNAPLVSFYTSSYLLSETKKQAKAIGALYHDLSDKYFSNDYSYRNRLLATALFVYATARVQSSLDQLDALLASFSFPSFPGRKERMTRGKRSFIFIGAHNVEGMRALYQAGLVFDHALVAFSIRPQSDVIAAGKIVRLITKSVDFTVFDHPKALPEDVTKALFPTCFLADWKAKVDQLMHQEGETVVMGSYYFIGEVQKYFATN